MLEQKHIQESLGRVVCYRCGAPLNNAECMPMTEAPTAFVAYVACKNCKAQSMVTITPVGIGTMPLVSDLKGNEVKRFMELNSVSYEEILELHKTLKKESVWNLLHKSVKRSEKKQKSLGKIEKSLQ